MHEKISKLKGNLECQVQLVINALKQLFENESKTIVPKRSELKKFMTEWKSRIDKSVWAPQNCTSYYQQGAPDKVSNWRLVKISTAEL